MKTIPPSACADETVDGEAKTCFFCTAFASAGSSGARPMSLQQVDEQNSLWVLSAALQLRFTSKVRPTPSSSSCTGRRLSPALKAKIEELWEPTIKTIPA